MQASTAVSIAGVDFGRLDAENERNLAKYFIDTGVVGKIRSGRKNVVVGRKGSGKTALFRYIDTATLGVPVERMDFDDYPWAMHRAIRDSGMPEESTYVASWKFFLNVSVLRFWSTADEAPTKLASLSSSLLEKLYGKEKPSRFGVLFDKVRRLRKFQGPEVTGLFSMGSFELDDPQSGPLMASSIHQWNKTIGEAVAAHFAEWPVTLTLDRLDDAWDGSEQAKSMLSGILKASRDFNQALRVSGPPAAIVFLRSDIYDTLRFNDKNKMSADIELLAWTEDKLLDVAIRRIASSTNTESEQAWSCVFTNQEMRQRASQRTYIAKRTMGRPRDIIAFCLSCQEVAGERGHVIVDNEDIYEAEARYSKHIYEELNDEFHKHAQDVLESVTIVKEIGRMRFSVDEWRRSFAARNVGATVAQADLALKRLFEAAVVGVPRKGGAGGGSGAEFIYQDPLLNFGTDITAHPALKKHLRLKE